MTRALGGKFEDVKTMVKIVKIEEEMGIGIISLETPLKKTTRMEVRLKLLLVYVMHGSD